MSEAAIHTAMDAARLFLSNTAERRRYINREMIRMDHESGLIHAHREGEQKGLQEGKEIGLQEGKQIGLQEGTTAGEEKLGRLIQILIQNHDFVNVQAASSDKAIREALYRKYNIV